MKQRMIRLLICLLACMGLSIFAAANAEQADGLEVHFLNVGRNDGILIRCGGEDVFIDAGGYYDGRDCIPYLRSVGLTELKYYIGTHAHEDHVGAGPIIMAAFPTQSVLQPHKRVREVIEDNARLPAERELVKNMEYINLTVGQQVTVGGATLTCLGPVEVIYADPEWGTENENSMVLMLTYGETDILLSADATSDTMLAMDAANPGCLKANVYKNAHHNQYTRDEIFSLIDPDYTIFSTSRNFMPKSEYIKLLNKYQSLPLATSDHHCGYIVLRTDGQEISFETQRRVESVELNKTELELYEGKKDRIKASVKPSGFAKLLLYSSSDPSVATVDETGYITGVSAGKAVITVRDGMGAYAECRVTVKPATMTLRKTELKVKQGSRVSASWKISPSGSKAVIEWASEDEGIATVDAKGRIRGVYPGVTRITATMPSGQVSAITVTVNPIKVTSVSISPSSASMTLGDQKTLKAKISPSNATWPEVTWTSEDESIVKINAGGTLTAVGVGKTTVTATTIEGKSRTAKITVKPVYVKKITLKADMTSGLIGGVTGRNQVNLSYAVEPLNATIQDVTWSTSNKKIATVDENGVVTGHSEGKVTITCKATDGSGRYSRIKLTFGKNELNRTVRAERGEVLLKANRIRYRTSQLEIQMTCSNRSGKKQTVALNGWLTLITPDGEQIPLRLVSEKARTLSNGSSKVYTYKIPLTANPKLIGLDLSRCDAVIVSPIGQ